MTLSLKKGSWIVPTVFFFYLRGFRSQGPFKLGKPKAFLRCSGPGKTRGGDMIGLVGVQKHYRNEIRTSYIYIHGPPLPRLEQDLLLRVATLLPDPLFTTLQHLETVLR